MKDVCSARNPYVNNKITDSQTKRIQRPPEDPNISGLPSNYLREGDSLTLSCIANQGSPLPTLKWFKQGEYISTQSFRTVSDSHSFR